MQILTSENIVDINKFLFAFSASLSSSLSDDLLARATVQVVTNLKNKTAKSEMTRTNIQMIGALRCDMFLTFSPFSYLVIINLAAINWYFSRAVGYRFGPHLGDTVPVLINYCTSASENDEELREYSLQVLCIFISHSY